MNPRSAFTLIELLIVVAIVAVLAVVVVVVLNPGQLILQGRDSNRVSNLDSLKDALSLYVTDQSVNGTVSLGTANTVYVSIPDPTATSTLGDQCQGLGLPTLPATYNYFCAASSTFRKTDGTGWIPVNFGKVTTGSPLGPLPADPVNSSSSRLYYTYTTDGTRFELTAALESAKYKLGGSGDVISTDGGPLATVYERGTKLGLEPLDYGDSALAGYWPLNEATGTTAYDSSGNGHTGTYSGSYTLGQQSLTSVGTSVDFVNQSGYASLGVDSRWSPASGTWTIAAWTKPLRTFINTTNYEIFSNEAYQNYGLLLRLQSNDASSPTAGLIHARTSQLGGSSVVQSNWSPDILPNKVIHVVWTNDGSMGSIYLNGSLVAGPTAQLHPVATLVASGIGGNGQFFNGLIENVRFYTRALSAAEVAALYNGGK